MERALERLQESIRVEELESGSGSPWIDRLPESHGWSLVEAGCLGGASLRAFAVPLVVAYLEVILQGDTPGPKTRSLAKLWRGVVGRYGLLGPPKTLESIGHQIGVSRERIRQIEAKAGKVMRHRDNGLLRHLL